jgi:hypothetical protein
MVITFNLVRLLVLQACVHHNLVFAVSVLTIVVQAAKVDHAGVVSPLVLQLFQQLVARQERVYHNLVIVVQLLNIVV